MSRRRRLVLFGPLIVMGVAAAGYLTLFVTARLAATPVEPHPFFTRRAGEHAPLVFAHQGGEALAPSNTMSAFTRAAELDSDVLDADLHLTADGIPVLIHDTTVDRTSNGAGAVADLTLAELRTLDFGYNFDPADYRPDIGPGSGADSDIDPDGDEETASLSPNLAADNTYPFRNRGVRIVTVEELFTEFDDMRFNIEIKQTDPSAAGIFCDLIRRFDNQDNIIVSSFGQDNMDAFRSACPEVATAATEGEVRTFYILHRLGLTGLVGGFGPPPYQSLQVPEYTGDILILSDDFVAAARELNLAVIPWTIDTTADLERIIALDVDGVNTNHPDRLINLITSEP